ncbi:FMRFamide receptor-like [Watersipora subatra]|uniref:FMRFamide receptor-like n=1 Tax=Watersipora subatra TaxID=2589382 RepID=UPI00355C7CC3
MGLNSSSEQTQLIAGISYYLSGITLLVVCILGLFANGLVTAVLSHRSSRGSSTNVFLLSLAMFDSIVLACTPFLICLQPLSQAYSDHVHPNIMPYVYPLALTAQTCTIWITVSFTLERWIAVNYPLKATSLCTVRRARIVTIAVACASILYNISRWFEYKTEKMIISNNDSVEVAYITRPTDLELNPKYESAYFTFLYLTIMCIIPICALSALNYLLIRGVQRSRKVNLSVGNRTRSSKENNITIMLVAVVAVFIVCQNFRNIFLQRFCKSRLGKIKGLAERKTLSTQNGSVSVQMPILDKNYKTNQLDNDSELGELEA